MCGIAGFVFSDRRLPAEPGIILQRMTAALAARGPDDEGHWVDPSAGVALGHRRLSIVDLSPAGHQPMMSASGRYAIVFNGEIYNHRSIRRELHASSAAGSAATPHDACRSWRGTSDTEVLLAAIEQWGIRDALKRCVGMFAFALWDRAKRTLVLVRDRLGEKPLYYGHWHGAFIFASELKAFQAIPGFSPGINKLALWQYFCQRAVPAPMSIYEGISKLEPGQMLTLSAAEGPTHRQPHLEYYWSLNDALNAPAFNGTSADAAEELTQRLKEAVKLQMVADVPVGAFLSGGIDSSTVVALMQATSNQTVQTYTVGFEETDFNEAPHASAVAKHLGTKHTEVTVTNAEALAVIPRLAEIWDEPFADSSQIPTAILSEITRRDVTVALSGDGGDELFCGYQRQLTAAAIERIPAKPFLGALLFAFNSPYKQMRLQALPVGQRSKAAMNRLGMLSEVLAFDGPAQRYMALSFQPDYWTSVLREPNGYPTDSLGSAVSGARDVLSLVSALDATTYLPTDILTKVDRAAMAVSLETRVPLLDHRIVEFAFSLPSSYKVRGGRTKWPLRQILNAYVPEELYDRPKMGFGVPLHDWLRGPLKPWAADLLFTRNSHCALLNQNVIEQAWRDHQSGAWNYTELLWRVLMFRSWQMRHGN